MLAEATLDQIDEFQFQDGAIKRKILLSHYSVKAGFQFQDGAIKRQYLTL